MADAQLLRVGVSQTPVVVVDNATGAHAVLCTLAQQLAPFSLSNDTYYPGLRRVLTDVDGDAFATASRTLELIAPYIGGAFNAESFDLLEVSFSIVTTPARDLLPAQCAPHFDAADPDQLAVVHYLNAQSDSGTAFYRQRRTNIERIDTTNRDIFIAEAERAFASGECPRDYINTSNAAYEQIGAVSAAQDRLLIYPGALLHSGIIPPGMEFSADPAQGRLTANYFLRCRPHTDDNLQRLV
jgi:hypothetical protein